jgi:DNA (cytosine-5)-methyltransferase 1
LGNEIVPDAPNGFRMTAFGQYEDDDSASTLKQRDHKDATDLVVGAVAYGMIGASSQEGALLEEQPSLTASHGQPGNVAVPAVLLTMREGAPGGGKGPLLVEEESLTLATGNGQTLFQPQPQQYGVRRLTPVECERLQAFPDGWTEPAGSDSARYKALGNAVTVNTVRWVLGRMLEQS